MSFIVKNYKLSLDDYYMIFSALYFKKFDQEIINLLQFASKIGFMEVQENSLYQDILTDFISNSKNIKKALSKFNVLIKNAKLETKLTENNDLELIKETLKTKMRSYIIQNGAEQILKIPLEIQTAEIISEEKFWQNIDELEKQLELIRDQLKFLERKYIEVDSQSLSNYVDSENSTQIYTSPIPDIIEYLETQRMYLISGLSKVGKSFFALNLFEKLYEMGYNVLYISLENTMREILSRLIVLSNSLHKFNENDYTLFDMKDKEKYTNLLNSFNKYISNKTNKFKIIEIPFLTVSGLLQLLTENSEFNIIFLDWLDLIYVSKENIFLAFSNIMRELYNFVKENQKILFCISQLNREAYGEDSKDSRFISRSWAKIEAADASIIVDRIDQDKLYVKLDCARYLEAPRDKIYFCDFKRALVRL